MPRQTRTHPRPKVTVATANGNGTSPNEEEPEEEKLSVGEPIELHRVTRSYVKVPIEGTTPLIINRFSEKARKQMEGGQGGHARVREPRNPKADYEAARYKIDTRRDGFQASGFKAATVGAARYFDNKRLSMTLLKQAIFVHGEHVDIEGKTEVLVPIEAKPHMRDGDPVRNANGIADLRYRPEYWPWGAVLIVEFIPNVLSLDAVISLVDAGGIGGVGEWRPSSKKSQTGIYGMYKVVDTEPFTATALPA